jgi:DmsE family decaheme c-type cytochrome
MWKRPLAVLLFGLLCYLGFTYIPVSASATQAEEDAEPLMACSTCHDIAEAFTHNPHAHGRLRDGEVPNRVCESCHGEGTAHMEAGGDPDLIFTPRGLTGADSCLMCHEATTAHRPTRAGATTGQQRTTSRRLPPPLAPGVPAPLPEQIVAFTQAAVANRGTATHANSAEVNCLTCHSIHEAEPRATALLVTRQLALCSTCHSPQAASFRAQPFAHRIGRGGMECSSCHDPHAPRGRENLRTAIGTDLPCLNCHTDKRGPFVFPHAAGQVGDCISCHTAHGSPNPKQLTRATVAQLCMECHSPVTGDTLGSQPPSFHNLMLPRYQNCTTCHVAVHGSNRSPQLLK